MWLGAGLLLDPASCLISVAHITDGIQVWSGRNQASAQSLPSGIENSDGETESTQLVAAVVGDFVRAPRRVPHPVDPQLIDQTGAD